LKRLNGTPREPIPEAVRLFVWQRDKGQCVKGGSKQRLEFDHIIPVVTGGSSTERNVQLLCEPCNRSKGSAVVRELIEAARSLDEFAERGRVVPEYREPSFMEPGLFHRARDLRGDVTMGWP
jgi:5-methylcytosine-specific restriction endonuclease McrA